MHSNRVVSTGQLADGTIISSPNVAGIIHFNWLNDPAGVFGNNSVHDNVSCLRRVRSGFWERFDYWFGVTPTFTANNVSCPPTTPEMPTPTDEANELLLWKQKLTDNGASVGMRIQ
jgi:hypothetical protein